MNPFSTDAYDVIVVGGGIVGLAHAYEASRRGYSVCVVERDPRCVGASVRNFGLVSVTGQAPGDSWRRALKSRDVWESLAPKCGIRILHRGLWIKATRPESHSLLEAFSETRMAQGCRLLSPDEAKLRAPNLRLDHAEAVMYSPHELRVESKEAIPKLSQWLAEVQGVQFVWNTAVTGVAPGRILTTLGAIKGRRIVVCPGADLRSLFPEYLRHLQLCTLQMLRVEAHAGLVLPGTVMGDFSLIRYPGFSTLPEARCLRERLADVEPVFLAQGIHLIVVQSADGSLIVGDSHHYGSCANPFSSEEINARILRLLHETLVLDSADVRERWQGVYPVDCGPDVLIEHPDDNIRLVLVTSGTGASTAFGIADDVFSAWQ